MAEHRLRFIGGEKVGATKEERKKRGCTEKGGGDRRGGDVLLILT